VRLVFLGPPGVGKGTHAKVLCAKHGLAHISTGEILREAVASGTPLGGKVRSYMERGLLVPDELVLQALRRRIAEPDAGAGFVLDGYPRNLKQAKDLERERVRVDRVVYFSAPEEALLKRIGGRRTCEACNRVYNVYFDPPAEPEVCACGGRLVVREDDREEVVRARLKEYAEKTAPLIEHYRARGLLVEVDAEGDIKTVYDRLENAIGKTGRE